MTDALTQVVVIVWHAEARGGSAKASHDTVLPVAQQLADTLRRAWLRVDLISPTFKPEWAANKYAIDGVPWCVELGLRDLVTGCATLVHVKSGDKAYVALAAIADIIHSGVLPRAVGRAQ